MQSPVILSRRPRRLEGKVLLVKPPYFTPWTPPLGIAILKAYLQQFNFQVTCQDLNTDPDLWGMHHKYFATLQRLEDISINDGYSKLWWILVGHMLAHVNGADAAGCSRVLKTIIPVYSIDYDSNIIEDLNPLIARYFWKLEELIEQLDLSGYSTVGTSTYTTSLASSLFFLRKVKQKYPHIKTVMGGGIFADDLALGSDNLATLLAEYPFVDHVVLGEGELLFLKLLQGDLADKRVLSISDVSGTTLPMEDIPAPDFSDFNLEKYYHLTIEGARSCPFQCSFCSETVQWGEYRKKAKGQFAQQVIDLADKYSNNTFFLGDSLMNPYIAGFAGELLERKANILYDGYLRADKPVADRERVKLWARSGVYRVRLGIESAARRVLKAMDKMTTPETISEVLKSLANAGIRPTTYWIVGFPGETEEDFQETLDFIREHHRYIYELEAHPYYYYPYGQIGSRLYESYSLYPEEVTKVIKFKAWEIVGANPTRQERYDRLRRLSELAAELGLPNIYTMTERYQAEERWQLLHPLAIEVYEGTRIHRNEVILPEQPIGVSSKKWIERPSERITGPDSVLCYHVTVQKQLDEKILSRSIDELIRFNELLVMSVHNGNYVAKCEDELNGEKVLHVYDCPEPADCLRAEIIQELSLQMRPEPRASIRVALINSNKQSCDLLLVVHRALADARATVLLFEDLFRIYEQISEAREVSLRPVQMPFSQFALECGSAVHLQQRSLTADEGAFGSQPGVYSRKIGTVSITLGKERTRRISSRAVDDSGLKPAQALVFAFLRGLAKTALGEHIAVDLVMDYRPASASLQYTAGALTHTFQLPQRIVTDEILLSNLEAMRECLEETYAETDAARRDERAETFGKLLLDFEYFVDDPWLGGDKWAPQGFVIHEGGIGSDYMIEATTFRGKDGLQVWMKFEDTPAMKQFAESLANCLNGEVDAILGHCEEQFEAKRFWLSEFGREAPQWNVETEGAQQGIIAYERASAFCRVESAVLDKVCCQSDADAATVLLAAYSILLSRLNGREDVLIVSSIGEGELTDTVPLRLFPFWSLTFKNYVGEVQRKTSLAIKYRARWSEVLANDLLNSNVASKCPVFDVGYIFAKSAAPVDGISRIEKALKRTLPVDRGPDLIMEVAKINGGVGIEFIYHRNRVGKELIEKLSSYLTSTLREAARNIDVNLGEILLDAGLKKYNVEEILARDLFRFN